MLFASFGEGTRDPLVTHMVMQSKRSAGDDCRRVMMSGVRESKGIQVVAFAIQGSRRKRIRRRRSGDLLTSNNTARQKRDRQKGKLIPLNVFLVFRILVCFSSLFFFLTLTLTSRRRKKIMKCMNVAVGLTIIDAPAFPFF